MLVVIVLSTCLRLIKVVYPGVCNENLLNQLCVVSQKRLFISVSFEELI